MRGTIRAALTLGLAVFAMGSTPNWNTRIVETAAGHMVGNPDAQVKLVTFVSYTCPHCGTFDRQSEGALRIVYIHPGRVSLEVRHYIRDSIDLTAAMLTNCGATSKFMGNHTAFMLSQEDWLGKAGNAPQATVQRWSSGAMDARRRAIAQDLGFYAIMSSRGYRKPEVDRCLNDNAMARKLAEQSAANGDTPGFEGTPSFMINGVLQNGVHSWRALQPLLDQRSRG